MLTFDEIIHNNKKQLPETKYVVNYWITFLLDESKLFEASIFEVAKETVRKERILSKVNKFNITSMEFSKKEAIIEHFT